MKTRPKEKELICSEELINKIDDYFPKGKHKDRGAVLLINAMSLIEGYKQGKALVYEEIRTARRCLIHCTYGRLPKVCDTTCINLGCPLNKYWSKK